MDRRIFLRSYVRGLRALGALVVCAGVFGLAWAQGSSAAGQAAAAAQKAGAANAAVPSIQSRVSLVSLDVVVTDASGHAVHALKPGDFSVMEDGQPMVLRSFGEYRADAVNPAPGPAVKLPENVFTNFTDVRSNGPLNVLLLDLLNTPMADQAVVRTQMLDYLKNIPAGTRMAVFGLNTQLTMLQGFTSDPKVLKAAIAAMGTKQSTLLRTAQDDDADNDALAMLNGDGDPTMAEVTQALQNFQAEGAAMQTEIRIEDTLGALDALARYLGGLPGRKNVIWFSGSFPAYMPNFFQGSPTGITKPFGPSVQQDFSGEIRITSDLLARAQAAVYPIDARGIFTNPALNVDTSQSSLTNPFVGGMPAAKTDTTAVPRAFAGSEAKMEKQTEEEHAAMDEMADQTGGKAQYGTNGLKAAVAGAIGNGENYYTMTYAPVNSDWNGNFRRIKVTTDRAGTQLLYRHGYFALASTRATNGRPGAAATLQQAMVHGAPNATQIVFRVKIDKASATESALPKGDQANAKKMKPPYLHYIVWYAADLRGVEFAQTPDGLYHGDVEYEAKVCDADGAAIDRIADVMHANLSPDKYAALLKQGLYVKQEIDAPAKGEYYLRIGMHDPASDHVGAMEIPLNVVKAAK